MVLLLPYHPPNLIAHTYLVAYLLVPYFLNKRLFPLFIVLFLLLFYGFSVLELILSNEFIYRWYQTGTELSDNYLAPANVIMSGLGNLYIVLVSGCQNHQGMVLCRYPK